jgi:hypothetical protein
MKKVLLVLTMGWALGSCYRQADLLPIDTWTNGCATLAPSQGAYRLQLECCSYVMLPSIKLRNRSFVQTGTYYTYTGAGYADSPARVTGQLSTDGRTLTVSYQVNTQSVTRTLQAGTQAAALCLCSCDLSGKLSMYEVQQHLSQLSIGARKLPA